MNNHMFSMHPTIANGANIAASVQAAKSAGYDALSTAYDTLLDYLDAGYTVNDLKAVLDDMPVTGVGWLCDIERQGDAFDTLLTEAENMFTLCEQIGATDVEILTGPLDMGAVRAHLEGSDYDGYIGLQELPIDEQIRFTARNIAILADKAAEYGLELHMEPLSWTPINDLKKGLEVIRQTGRDNFKIIIDFWQLNNAGVTPEEVAAVPKDMIGVIHVCSGRRPDRGVPYESEEFLRNASLANGIVDIEKWVKAVKKTGYVGYWTCECFDKKQNQMPLLESAQKNYLELTSYIK